MYSGVIHSCHSKPDKELGNKHIPVNPPTIGDGPTKSMKNSESPTYKCQICGR